MDLCSRQSLTGGYCTMFKGKMKANKKLFLINLLEKKDTLLLMISENKLLKNIQDLLLIEAVK